MIQNNSAAQLPAPIVMRLEAVVIPVSDVDRAKAFYEGLGWRLDADFRFDNGFRVVQFTPRGSGASLQFGTKVTPSAPGSSQSLYLVAGRIDSVGAQFASANDLTGALERAAAAHGEHEKRIGQHDANWPDWYAAYIVAEQSGLPLPK